MPAQTVYRAALSAANDILSKRVYTGGNDQFQDDFHRTHTIISTGAIVGIVIAVVGFILFVSAVACLCVRSRRRRRRVQNVDNYGYGPGYQKERYSHSTMGGGDYQYGHGVTGMPAAHTAHHHHHHGVGGLGGAHAGGHHGGHHV